MTILQIMGTGVVGAIVLGVVVLLITVNVQALEHKLWPRGLRWFPGAWLGLFEALHRGALRVFWPEKLAGFKTRALLRLEEYDAQWRCWAGVSADGPPVWKPWNAGRPDVGRWTPRERDLCPCGYGSECGLWCGLGHADGRCPAHNPEPAVVPSPGVVMER